MQHLQTFIMGLSIKQREDKYPIDKWKKSVDHTANKTPGINILQFSLHM